MAEFVVSFHQNCVFPGFWDNEGKNCFPDSMTCLYSNPFMWVKTSVSCCGVLPFNKSIEICLQNGKVIYIWSNTSNLSTVRGLSV